MISYCHGAPTNVFQSLEHVVMKACDGANHIVLGILPNVAAGFSRFGGGEALVNVTQILGA